MLKTYTIDSGRVVEAPAGQERPGQILVFIAPDEAERRSLFSDWDIDEHTLNSALDPDELARLEYKDDCLAIIVKRPKNYCASDNFLFRVSSYGVFLFRNQLLVVLSEEVPLFDTKQNQKIQSLNDVFLRIIYRPIYHFLEHLKVINMISEELEQKITSSMENKYLLNMFSLEKSLVYYLNAVNANGVVIEKIRSNSAKISLTAEQLEFLDDMLIENTQCFKQAEIYSNILAGLMDARASIVNNNVNVLMKQLTILSIVFMPLNILAGIGGMSEFSVMARGQMESHVWIWYGIFCLGLFAVAYLTYRILMFVLEKSKSSP